MSSKGILHTSVGSDLTKTEWEQDGSHYLSSGTSFPVAPAESDLYYRADLHKLYQYNASAWVDLSNTVGTTDHGLMGGLTDDDHTQYLLGSGGRTLSGNWAVGGYDITGVKMISGTTITIQQFRGGATFNASGEAPFLVSSTFNVTNLSADMIDGYHVASLALSGHTHDHGAIGGLLDDDHTQYLLASGGRTLTGNWAVSNWDITGIKALSATTLTVQQIVAGATFNASGAAPFIVSSTFNVSNLSADFLDGYHASTFSLSGHTHDHGALGGLSDDDHTIYLLATGARALSGAISHGGYDITNIGRATGVTIYVGTTDTYLTRTGTATLQTQNFVPDTDSSFALGTVGREWKNLYVDNIYTTSFLQSVSFGGFNTSNIGRVTGVTIYVGTTDTYLIRSGAASVQTHNIVSVTDSTYSLGTVGNEWKNIYVDNIYATAVASAISHSGYDITNIGRLTGVTIYVGTTDTYLNRIGAATLGVQHVLPITDATYHLGGSANQFKNIYFSGTIYQGGTQFVGGSGVSDHGSLTGLTDDDHTQYLLTSGARTLTGDWAVGWHGISNVSTITSKAHIIGLSSTIDNNSEGFGTSATDDFLVGGSIYIWHYGMGWASWSGDPEAWISGYNGVRFFTLGEERLKISSSQTSFSAATPVTAGTIRPHANFGSDLGTTSYAWGRVYASTIHGIIATPGSIDHNSLLNYAAARHYDHSTISVVAGAGLTGGGDISANRTITWSGATIDHGVFTGLTDDDHSIYLLATGARALSGAISHGGFDITNIGKVTGVTIYVGTTDTYLIRSGAASVQTHNIVSVTDSTYSLGTVGNEWKGIYVDNIYATAFGQAVSHGGYEITNVKFLTGLTINVGTTDTYLVRAGAASVQTHNIVSITDSTYSLGTVGNEWKNLYVDNIYATSFVSANAHSGYDITNVGRLTGVTIYVGTTDTYLTRAGTATMQVQNFVPDTDSSFALGTVGREWKNIYVDNIYATAFAQGISHGGYDVTNVGRVTGVTIYVGTTDTYLIRSGAATVQTQHIVSLTDSTYNLGASGNEWKNVYADTIYVSGATFTGRASGLYDYLDAKFLSHSSITWTAGTGLTGGGDLASSRTLSISHLGIQSLADPNVDKMIYWHDTGGTVSWLGIGTNLAISGGTLNATGGGVTDHGSLTGLSDDDHTIYSLVNGTRAYSGAVSFGGFDATNIGRVTATTIYVGTTDTSFVRYGAGTIQTSAFMSRGHMPESDATYDLGNSAAYWDDLYTVKIRLPNADESGISDSFAVGLTSYGTIRDASIFGMALMAGTDGFYRADADSSSSVPVVGILASTTVSAGSTGRILFYGIIRRDAWALTAGAPVYLSTTSGSVTSTAPSGDGDQVQRIGVALTTNVILFRPDLTVIEVVA